MKATKEIKTPMLKYFGSKWRLAPWIIENLPEHELYVEPFTGSGAVLFRKPRSKKELINDIDGDLYNLYRVIQNPDTCSLLIRALKRTPYHRRAYECAFEDKAYGPHDAVREAKNYVVRSFMAVHPEGVHKETVGFSRSNHITEGSGHWNPREWMNYPRALASIHKRLQNVLIEQRSALHIIKEQDREDTCFYCDPPYVPGVRSAGSYRYEMTEQEHVDLLECLKNVRGRVVLSGYANPLYDEALAGWQRVTRREQANGGRKTEEVLWIK